ncbi:hypothetical protein [Sporosarcina sp. FSL K6-3457]|uniref:hypothetical protein n=1 Tax=Sporosarcina sp. FSL K6-3457 TaxID=2978204 RepID=UPI0030F61BF8
MTINAVEPYQTTALYAKSTAVKTAATGEQVFNVPKTVATTQKDSSTVYEELSGKYDVRNATFDEIVAISNTLYEAGEISLKEHALITFDYERATNYLKRNAPGVPANFNMYETAANGIGQRDWIAEFGARASSNFKYGNLVGYQTNSKVLAILQKLDTRQD